VLAPDGQTGFIVRQGAEVGRPSELGVLVEAVGGAAVATAVEGSVVRVARGELIALP
jgi:trans-2,3-dihydro-3-hydroxyanthranilate isomerase